MIERELKVSELRPGMVVRIWKQGRPTAQMTVLAIQDNGVAFEGPVIGFLARRCGPGLEQITDDDRLPMRMFA